ncbi:MAG: hypothetical protein ACE5KM_16825, partial [Planctomycetaceae bacterium]
PARTIARSDGIEVRGVTAFFVRHDSRFRVRGGGDCRKKVANTKNLAILATLQKTRGKQSILKATMPRLPSFQNLAMLQKRSW